MQTSADYDARLSADCSAGEDESLFLAGRMAPAGTYRLVETGREVRLDQDGVLPATLDGHIAVYELRPPTWAEAQDRMERA